MISNNQKQAARYKLNENPQSLKYTLIRSGNFHFIGMSQFICLRVRLQKNRRTQNRLNQINQSQSNTKIQFKKMNTSIEFV